MDTIPPHLHTILHDQGFSDDDLEELERAGKFEVEDDGNGTTTVRILDGVFTFVGEEATTTTMPSAMAQELLAVRHVDDDLVHQVERSISDAEAVRQ